MNPRTWLSGIALVVAVLLTSVAHGDDAELAAQIEELVASLDADTISERDIAEQNLLLLVDVEGVGPERFLAALPKPNENMPPSVRERLATIRKAVEERVATSAVEAATVSLNAIQWPLAEVLKELEKLSGNKLVDKRDAEVIAASPPIILQVENESFWSVLDQVMDQARLSHYAYAGEDAVALVPREEGEAERFGRASYAGPFRFEVTDVVANRGIRLPENKAVNVALEIAWEPRLRPIAIAQEIDRMDAVTGDGKRLTPRQPGRVFQIEVQEGTGATTITAPFELPARSVEEITTLSGTMVALVPGKREMFKFEDLKPKSPVAQSRGGVKVTLEKVVENGPVWEVHMTLTLENDNDALASHRGWVFSNPSYLLNKAGERVDHAGFETTKQTPTEVGIAYLFDLPDGIEGMSWVYESPTSIVRQEYKYQVEGIKLP